MKKIMLSLLAILAILLIIIFLGFFDIAKAEDFSTAFTKTVSEIPDGADGAGMGGATTATPDFSSKNPALIAVETSEKPIKGSVSAHYWFIKFYDGPNVSIGSLSATAKLPVGVLQVVGSYAGSNTGEMGELDSIKINNSPSIGIQYGLPVPVVKDLYLGLSYNYSQSKITARTTFVDLLDTEITSKSKGHEVGAGMLYRMFDKKVNAGLFYAHAWDKEETFIDGSSDSIENSQTDQVRFGVSANVTSMTMISAEVRHYWFPDGVTDTQYFAGIEQYVIKDFLAVYGGYANGGLTAGLGAYFEQGGLNLAYMYRPFRSTEEFLGKAEAVMLSAYVTF